MCRCWRPPTQRPKIHRGTDSANTAHFYSQDIFHQSCSCRGQTKQYKDLIGNPERRREKGCNRSSPISIHDTDDSDQTFSFLTYHRYRR